MSENFSLLFSFAFILFIFLKSLEDNTIGSNDEISFNIIYLLET
jgi:hypothetical protein